MVLQYHINCKKNNMNEELNKLVVNLGYTKYKRDAEKIKNIVENEFNIENFNKADLPKVENIISSIENEHHIIMEAVLKLFPSFKEIKENNDIYVKLVKNLKTGEKNFKKFVLDDTLNINELSNKDQLLLICKYN